MMSAECRNADVVMAAHSPPAALFAAAGHRSPQPSDLSTVFYQNLRLVIPSRKPSLLAVRRSNQRAAAAAAAAAEDGQQPQQQQPPPSSSSSSASPSSCRPQQPRRPCLVVRADSDGSMDGSSSSSSGSSSDENEPASPTRRKKRVVFADDRGLSLTQVRLMNEPSNQPPKLMGAGPYLQQNQLSSSSSSSSLSSSLSTAVTAAASGRLRSANCGDGGGHAPHGRWRLLFPQPASNYVDFRRRLDTGNVSLENVIVRSSDRRIIGTVKVRNVSYDKVVFVRCTDDGWATHRDTACVYVRNNNCNSGGNGFGGGGGGGAATGGPPSAASPSPAVYDTFSFRLPLPVHASTVEFAVCYRTADFECWDNNADANYRLSFDGQQPQQQQQQKQQQHHEQQPSTSLSPLPPAETSAATADTDRPQQLAAPVHYFGAHSGNNSWTVWRDRHTDISTYW